MDTLNFFQNNLPKKPYCTDQLAYGLLIRSLSAAINCRYIQYNQPNSITWLVIDIDHEDTYIDDLNPKPNIIAYNRENNRCHVFYALEIAVHQNLDSSIKALNYLAAVQYALTEKLKGDHAFSGLICKNPLSDHWRVELVHDNLWDLDYLSEFLDLTLQRMKEQSQRMKDNPVGLGRNCFIFQDCREWSYRSVRDFLDLGSREWWEEVRKRCHGLNNGLEIPLMLIEVEHIAKSIYSWVWKRRYEFITHRQEWIQKQSYRGKAGGKIGGKIASGVNGAKASAKVRAWKNKDKRFRAFQMFSNGLNKAEIAISLGVSRPTVYAWLKQR
jgi:hypothetical protein